MSWVTTATTLSVATLGPNTLTLFLAAGAEHRGHVLWTAVVTAAVALVLHEAAARLTVVSGHTLGEAFLLTSSPSSWRAAARKLAAAFVLVAALINEAAYYSAADPAVNLLATSDSGRQALGVLLATLTAALLLAGSIERLAPLLAVTALLMLGCSIGSLVGAGRCGADRRSWAGVVGGRPAETALELIGGVAVPHALFVASSLARGATSLGGVRCGVLLASVLSAVLALLLLLLGTHVPPHSVEQHLGSPLATLDELVGVLQRAAGRAAVAALGVVLLGAGVTSLLTVPLAAAMAIEDLLGLREPAAAEATTPEKAPPRSLAARRSLDFDAATPVAAAAGAVSLTDGRWFCCCVRPCRGPYEAWRRYYRPLLLVMVALLGRAAAAAPAARVAAAARVANGVALPCVVVPLLLGLNSSALMAARPQPGYLNALLAPCVALALYLGLGDLLAALVGGTAGAASIVGTAPLAAVLVGALLVRLERQRRWPWAPGDEAALDGFPRVLRRADESLINRVDSGDDSLDEKIHRSPCVRGVELRDVSAGAIEGA